MNDVRISNVFPKSLEVVTTIICSRESAETFFDSELFKEKKYKDLYPYIRDFYKEKFNEYEVSVVATSHVVFSTDLQILTNLGSAQERAINSLINLSKEISVLNQCTAISSNVFKTIKNTDISTDDKL